MQFSSNKSEYIINISRLIEGGMLDYNKIGKLDYEEAKMSLKTVKGIGDWTADYVLMKYFRFPEALPIGDAGLNAALRREAGSEKKLSLIEMHEITKKWGKHSAYATFYLWRSLYV